LSTNNEIHGSELVLEQVTKIFASVAAVDQVSLRVAPSEFLTLLGPSGSGKTTLLRMVGGFLSPNSGRIMIDGVDVVDVPVERRPTAMLFQQLSLWPHLTVARNISFGLELRRGPKAEIASRVSELLSVVGLSGFEDRLPSQLSGGQQQRVALARALALEPRILLLDEPFSALDTKLRIELRTFVRRLQREVGTTTILVTHDQEEALELSDRIVVLRDGKVEQIGEPTEIYDSPRTSFVAEFLGSMSFLSGSLAARGVRLEGGEEVEVQEAFDHVPGTPKIGVRPEDVLVSANESSGAFVIERITRKGYFNELSLSCGGVSLASYVGREVPGSIHSRVDVRMRKIHLFSEDGDAIGTMNGGGTTDAIGGDLGQARATEFSGAQETGR